MQAIVRNGRVVWPRKSTKSGAASGNSTRRAVGEIPNLDSKCRRAKEKHEIIERDEVGVADPLLGYRSRSEVFVTMKVGEARFFRARTNVERASVRGSAYNFVGSRRGVGKLFVCRHIKPDIVGVYREK